jgi:hypothetical protein
MWGINPKVDVWMYKAVVLLKLLYASMVWWPMGTRVEAKNVVQSFQGSYLRAAVESIRTTTTEALEVATCHTSLDLATVGVARFTVFRLMCRGQWRDTGLGHTKLCFL